MRKYFILVIGCTILGLLFFLFMHYSETGMVPSFQNEKKKFLLAIALTNTFGMLVFQVDKLLDRVIHWKNSFLLRFISGLGADTLLVLLFFPAAGNSRAAESCAAAPPCSGPACVYSGRRCERFGAPARSRWCR